MEIRRFVRLGPKVMAFGLGRMSIGIGDTRTRSVKHDAPANTLIQRALDFETTMLASAAIYGDSERPIRRAIVARRSDVALATQFGFIADRRRAGECSVGRPESVDAVAGERYNETMRGWVGRRDSGVSAAQLCGHARCGHV